MPAAAPAIFEPNLRTNAEGSEGLSLSVFPDTFRFICLIYESLARPKHCKTLGRSASNIA